MTNHESDFDAKKAQRLAAAYNPDDDAQAERIRALGDAMTPAMRIALGHHDNARNAARNAKEN